MRDTIQTKIKTNNPCVSIYTHFVYPPPFLPRNRNHKVNMWNFNFDLSKKSENKDTKAEEAKPYVNKWNFDFDLKKKPGDKDTKAEEAKPYVNKWNFGLVLDKTPAKPAGKPSNLMNSERPAAGGAIKSPYRFGSACPPAQNPASAVFSVALAMIRNHDDAHYDYALRHMTAEGPVSCGSYIANPGMKHVYRATEALAATVGTKPKGLFSFDDGDEEWRTQQQNVLWWVLNTGGDVGIGCECEGPCAPLRISIDVPGFIKRELAKRAGEEPRDSSPSGPQGSGSSSPVRGFAPPAYCLDMFAQQGQVGGDAVHASQDARSLEDDYGSESQESSVDFAAMYRSGTGDQAHTSHYRRIGEPVNLEMEALRMRDATTCRAVSRRVPTTRGIAAPPPAMGPSTAPTKTNKQTIGDLAQANDSYFTYVPDRERVGEPIERETEHIGMCIAAAANEDEDKVETQETETEACGEKTQRAHDNQDAHRLGRVHAQAHEQALGLARDSALPQQQQLEQTRFPGTLPGLPLHPNFYRRVGEPMDMEMEENRMRFLNLYGLDNEHVPGARASGNTVTTVTTTTTTTTTTTNLAGSSESKTTTTTTTTKTTQTRSSGQPNRMSHGALGRSSSRDDLANPPPANLTGRPMSMEDTTTHAGPLPPVIPW